MPLQVWTARISCRDPDVLNITRKSGNQVYAPSWRLLGPALARRRENVQLTDEEWKRAYAAPYLREMAQSSKLHHTIWSHLLKQRRVVLVCYCVNSKRCHRTLLGLFLQQRLGAEYRGELDTDEDQRAAFDAAQDLE